MIGKARWKIGQRSSLTKATTASKTGCRVFVQKLLISVKTVFTMSWMTGKTSSNAGCRLSLIKATIALRAGETYSVQTSQMAYRAL